MFLFVGGRSDDVVVGAQTPLNVDVLKRVSFEEQTSA